MNYSINRELIEEIQKSTDLVDVVSRYVNLTPRGKNYFGVCPFHDDNNPSMSVAKDKQIYKCFSCGATGNVFKFIQDYENISFLDAVKKCADWANISVNIKTANSINNERFKNLYEIYNNSMKFYYGLLKTKEGNEAREYLKTREIDDSIINTFNIGLSIKDRSVLTKYLTNLGFKKKDMINSGLILENNFGINDMYCNRIMFPLEDLKGRVVGFSGRIYNIKDNSKYINTRETDIFKKGETLYNYNRAKEECRNKGTVIIMEGFMDVIRAYTIGVKNVVATMGTSVTDKQASEISKMANNIILCFDGDAAGAKATFSCSKELNKIGIEPKVVRLEENLDPDEYIRKYGKDKFINKIENPISVLDFKLTYYKKDRNLDNPIEMTSYINDLIKELKDISDDILREITINKIATDLNINGDIIRNKLNVKKEVVKTNEKVAKPAIVKEVIPVVEDIPVEYIPPIEEKIVEKPVKRKPLKLAVKYQKSEEYLLYYMLYSEDVIRKFDESFTYFPSFKARQLAREISQFFHKYNSFDLDLFKNYISKVNDLNDLLNVILELELKKEASKEEINDYINTIRRYNIESRISKLQTKLNNNKNDLEKAQDILVEISKLKIELGKLSY